MRIVGGEFGGRRLAGPSSTAIRPTSDRTREALFNILSNLTDFKGSRVIDLFAGSGALGLEALSRGAAFAQFVESGVEGCGLIRKNIEALGVAGRTQLYRRDATAIGAPGAMPPFDIAFADPPYGEGMGERALARLAAGGWLASGAIAVLEESRKAFPRAIAGLEFADLREYGATSIGIFRHPG